MRAVVHIGAPKTGSSTLQEFLFLNATALAEQGFRFKRNVEGRGSQYEFPLAALGRIDTLPPSSYDRIKYSSENMAEHKAIGERHLAELARDVQGWMEPVALFSTEHASPWLRTDDAVAAFHAIFAGHFSDVRYVLYLRRHEDLIVSQYSEAIKRSSDEPLQRFFTRRLRSMDHYPIVERWVKAVGRQRMDIRLLDPTFLANGDLLDDYCHACGIDPAPLARPPRVNESLSAPAAEVLRVFNHKVPALLADGSSNPLRDGLVETLTEMSKDGPRIALNEMQRQTLAKSVDAGNERLRSEFFPERAALFSGSSARPAGKPLETCREALDMSVQLVIQHRVDRSTVSLRQTPTPTQTPTRNRWARLLSRVRGASTSR